MTFYLNQSPQTISEPMNIMQLLQRQSLQEAGTAVAINQRVLPHAQWQSYHIKENDKVDIFNVVAGG
ncbi:MAG: sulfur carrier protein ThiS [Aestuariibacter sp.]